MSVVARTLLSWSTGKDSAWALHVLRSDPAVEVAGLLTTVNETHERVAMHAVRRELLHTQARATGLPVWEIPIPSPCSNDAYEAAMADALRRARGEGVTAIAFGDLFLQDVRDYREQKLAGSGLMPLFPLWQMPTPELALTMLRAGLKARLTCVDPKQLNRSFVGREFDAALLNDLPAKVDPCGERGEFHSFAYAGPMFERAIPIRAGEVVERDGFVFADLLLASEGSPR